MTRSWIAGCFLAFIAFFNLVHAEGGAHEGHHPWIVEKAPAVYVVRDGDTLWDIACMFLKDPWRWVQVWQANPGIDDPNLIYPGDKILLGYVNGEPKIRVERLSARSQVIRTEMSGGIVKLHPRVRSYPADKAIPTIPLEVIGPFLEQSRVITPEEAKYCPPISALDEEHLITGAIGDIVYVTGLSKLNPDKIFTVVKPGKCYFHPVTKNPLGVEGKVLGQVALDKAGEPARMTISQSLAEINVGDKIMETGNNEIDPFFFPKPPIGPAHGYIISVFGQVDETDEYGFFEASAYAHNQMGQYQVVVITGGKDEMRNIGDVLAIYQLPADPMKSFLTRQKRPLTFPPLKVGLCMVFKVFDRASFALIMESTRGIYLLDEVRRP